MKAVFNTARGKASDTLEIRECNAPTPKAGDVLVAVKASGVNPSDYKVRSGAQGPMVADAVLIHNDGAGVITAVGEGVDPARIGQPVWMYNVNRSVDGLGQGVNGTAAELVTVPAALAVELPEQATFEQGACLGVPAMTAHRAVMCGGSVKGKTVLVTGGAGSVGHSAIEIAKSMGARVITTVSSDTKAEIAKSAGADVIINYKTEDLQARLKDVAPNGIEHVAEVDLAAHVDLYPLVCSLNASVGAYASAKSVTPTVPFYPLAFRNIQIQPIFVYSMSHVAKAEAIKDISRLLRNGQLKPRIGAEFGMDQVVAAHEAVESGTLVGNAVLTI